MLYGTISGRDAEQIRKHVADGPAHLDLSHRASRREQGPQQIHHDVVIRDTKLFDQLTSPTRLDSQECRAGQGVQQSDAVKVAITTDGKVGMEQPPPASERRQHLNPRTWQFDWPLL